MKSLDATLKKRIGFLQIKTRKLFVIVDTKADRGLEFSHELRMADQCIGRLLEVKKLSKELRGRK